MDRTRKRDGRTDGLTDGLTDGRTVRLLYASQSSFGGIKKKKDFQKKSINQGTTVPWESGQCMCMSHKLSAPPPPPPPPPPKKKVFELIKKEIGSPVTQLQSAKNKCCVCELDILSPFLYTYVVYGTTETLK